MSYINKQTVVAFFIGVFVLGFGYLVVDLKIRVSGIERNFAQAVINVVNEAVQQAQQQNTQEAPKK